MSITAETAKQHANDPAVLCCRAEAGIIFDELVDSGLLTLDGCLKIKQVLGAKLTKTCDSLSPLTVDNVEGWKDDAGEEAPAQEPGGEAEAPAAVEAAASVEGAVTTIRNGKVYLELPI